MVAPFNFRHLDVPAFAQAGAHLHGQAPLADMPRLLADLHAPAPDAAVPSAVQWQAWGERCRAADGSVRDALRLQVAASLPLACQRCMDALPWQAEIDRRFIFAPDEASAAALDGESEDDVLAQSAAFDLLALIEDELLMALPLVPRHAQCAVDVPMSAESEGFAQEQARVEHPFAALAALRVGKGG